ASTPGITTWVMSSRFSGLPETAIATSNPASSASLAMRGLRVPLRGPLCVSPPAGSPSRSPLAFLRLGTLGRLEMGLQRPQDACERLELLRRQRIGEMLLDGPHVWCGRAPEDALALGGQRDLCSAAVGGAFAPPDQLPP